MKYSLDQLRQVQGIGKKTIQRIKDQFNEDDYISKYDPSIHIEPNSLINGDMLEVMNGIPDKSVDMILTDPPYGTTACSWDNVIPFDKMWKQYNRVIKDNGAIVLFGSEPFSSRLRMSNFDSYKYDWIWEKSRSSKHVNAPYQPLKNCENIIVFSKSASTYSTKGCMKYFPQGLKMLKAPNITKITKRNGKTNGIYNTNPNTKTTVQRYTNYPRQILTIKNSSEKLHPTQKPVELLEYLIKTYTNEGETVLDSTMGSGSTGVACKNTNRKFIGIELDKNYYEIAKKRINET